MNSSVYELYTLEKRISCKHIDFHGEIFFLEPPQYCMVTENDICDDRVKQFIAEDMEQQG